MNQAEKMRSVAERAALAHEKSEYTTVMKEIAKAARKPAYKLRFTIVYQATVNKLRGEGFVVTTSTPDDAQLSEKEFIISWEKHLAIPKDRAYGNSDAKGGVERNGKSKRENNR